MMCEITIEKLATVNQNILRTLNERLKQKGRNTFRSPHEALGWITEEYHEYVDAVHIGSTAQRIAELIDIAVACWLALTSEDWS